MQSIKEKLKKSKPTLFFINIASKYGHIGYVTSLVLLVGISTFFIGQLMTIYKYRAPISVIYAADSIQKVETGITSSEKSKTISTTTSFGAYVASKTGKSYYFPWCATAKRIKDSNKVWFTSTSTAEKAGYKPATNCPGLK